MTINTVLGMTFVFIQKTRDMSFVWIKVRPEVPSTSESILNQVFRLLNKNLKLIFLFFLFIAFN